MEIAALFISGLSLLVACASLALSFKSQSLQDKVNEIELKLKEYALAEKEEEQKKEACVEARIIHISKGKYKMKIWNSGNAIAKNVVATWNEDSEILVFDKEKMPFEFLEPQKSFELSVSTYFGSKRKVRIETTWEGDDGYKSNKVQWCDF